MSDKDAISWSEKFGLGIQSIDQQHKKLVDMINSLHREMKSGKGDQAVNNTIEEMNKYVQHHFQFEENLMKKIEYSLDEHIIKHNEFKKYIKEIAIKHSKRRLTKENVDKELVNYLVNWLVNHIVVEDRQYVECYTRYQQKIKSQEE